MELYYSDVDHGFSNFNCACLRSACLSLSCVLLVLYYALCLLLQYMVGRILDELSLSHCLL
jgi:hypothetical protein